MLIYLNLEEEQTPEMWFEEEGFSDSQLCFNTNKFDNSDINPFRTSKKDKAIYNTETNNIIFKVKCYFCDNNRAETLLHSGHSICFKCKKEHVDNVGY